MPSSLTTIHKLTTLTEQARALREVNLQQSAIYSQEACDFLEHLAAQQEELPPNLVAEVWHLYAEIQLEMGAYGSALLYARRALPIWGELAEQGKRADLLRIIGRSYSYMGDFSEAIAHFRHGLALAHELDDTKRISRLLISISTVHYHAGNFEQALQTEMEILHLVQGTADVRGEVIALNNAALTYLRLGQYDLALEYGRLALAQCPPTGEGSLRGDVLDTMGTVYMACDQPAEALTYFHEARTILGQGYRQGLVELHTNISRAYLALEETEQALHHAQVGYELAQQLEARLNVSEYASLLAQIHKKQGNFEAALTSYEEAHQLERDLFNKELADRIANLQVVYRTEAAHREAEIYQLKTVELERMVAERTQELSAALEREQRLADELRWALERETALSKLKSRVIAAVSHEFRTPLTIISTSAALLDKYYDRMEADKRTTQFERIRAAITYLDELLRDVLLIETANTPEFQPLCQEMPLAAVAEHLAAEFSQQAGAERVRVVEIASQRVVQLDYGRVKQIIGSLVSNALKYSEPETEVVITVEELAKTWRIAVADKGIGIPVNEQALLFEPFARASNVQAQRGLGLGLHIARRLSEPLHGRLWFHSEGEDLGSTFFLELPQRWAAEEQRGRGAEETNS
jgi:signal transduction histidine kinase